MEIGLIKIFSTNGTEMPIDELFKALDRSLTKTLDEDKESAIESARWKGNDWRTTARKLGEADGIETAKNSVSEMLNAWRIVCERNMHNAELTGADRRPG